MRKFSFYFSLHFISKNAKGVKLINGRKGRIGFSFLPITLFYFLVKQSVGINLKTEDENIERNQRARKDMRRI